MIIRQKRWIDWLCFVAGIVLLLSFPFLEVTAEASEGEDDILRIGVPFDRCPMFYMEEGEDEVTGIGVDLMRMAAEEAGYQADFICIEESTLKEALDNSRYDVVMPFGSAIKSAAGREIIISDNLIQTPFTLVSDERQTFPPLNKLKVGMLESLSGAAETVSQLYPGIEIGKYATMDECVKALRAGEVDALLHNSYVWSYILQKPSYSDLSVRPAAMFLMDFRAAALGTPAGQAIIERLNGGIAALSNPRCEAVILDYTTRRLYKYDIYDYFYQYRIVLICGALLFAVFVLLILQRRKTLLLEHEQEMRRMRDHDPLTGLYNMNGFRGRAEELLREYPGTPYMLYYNNIRNLKYINNLLGKATGDSLLRYWGEEAQKLLSDAEVVGRIENDRFAVLRRINGDDTLAQDERHLYANVRDYFVRQGRNSLVQCCRGIYVLTPQDYRNMDVDRMLDYARVAEQWASSSMSEGYVFYNPDQWDKGLRTAEINSHLPIAIRSGEIEVWYQPQVDFVRGEITGVEALCRWHHPHLDHLSPSEFIPTLEKSGLIYDLDSFIWDRVCADLRRWNEAGLHRSASVNLSRSSIREDRDIPAIFSELIRKYGLTTDQLRIEITESAYIEAHDLLLSTTVRLRELGFKVEMDDFGSGYSSLHMLKEVPVDRIKLDLQFLDKNGDLEKGHVIIGHISRMVHELGMDLIVEGVENEDQVRFLVAQECHEMQGFYFYRPMPVTSLESLEAFKRTRS